LFILIFLIFASPFDQAAKKTAPPHVKNNTQSGAGRGAIKPACAAAIPSTTCETNGRGGAPVQPGNRG